jgi:transposase
LSIELELKQDPMNQPIPSKPINREEIRAVYAQEEDVVIALVEGLLERISQLEARLETLEN